MNPLYPQLQHDPLALGKSGKGGHRYEGHSQFLMAVAAEQEGSAKLTLKAAKAEHGRCTRNPRRFLRTPWSWHLLVICAVPMFPLLKALPSRTLHGGPSCDISACVSVCVRALGHLVSRSCQGLYPATLQVLGGSCSVYSGPAGAGSVLSFPGLARQGRVAAKEVGTVTPARPDLF